jgi:sterol 3beta-glucosyltransferase
VNKIALTTIGSRGDIQPYISLGIELQKNGHRVTILTHPWAKQIINFYGLTHIPVGEDIDIDYSARQFVENSSSNLKGFKFALNFIFDNLRKCHKDLISALQDFDLIIGHGIVGQTEADLLGKPFITISIATMGLQKEYWKSKNFIREFRLYTSDKLMGAIFGGPYKRFRADVKAPPLSQVNKFPYLAIVPIPQFLEKPNANWKVQTEITGFLLADTPAEYSPPNDLIKFLSNGERPVLVTFGSMFHNPDQTKHLYLAIYDAIGKAGSKAVLIMPDLNLLENAIPGNIFVAKQIPYSWLLARVGLVVHHFGFGTTAEVLRAGLPSIPVPHIFDQKIRALNIHKSGYAHKPLDVNKINGNILADAIIRVKNDPEIKERCADAGILISRENGNSKAAELINNYIKQMDNHG